MRQKIYLINIVGIVFIIATIILTTDLVIAAENSVPKLINYQGFLTDKDGKALTGTYNITFRLYDEASGLNPWLWQETQDTVTVVSGQFNVLLGSVSTLSADDFNGDRYLGIQVAGELEMEPRMQLVSVAYSLQAEHANTAGKADLLDIQNQKLDPNNGYVVIGSLIIQWGNFKSTINGEQTIRFETAFPTNCCSVFLNRQIEGAQSPMEAYKFDKESFKVNRENGIDGTPTINYIAIGY